MRILHTMLRVRSLDVSIRFYNEVLGMKLLSRTDFDAGRFTLAFLGYQDGDSSSTIELTHNWDRSDYVLGDGYGHIAIGADELHNAENPYEYDGETRPIPTLSALTEMFASTIEQEDYLMGAHQQRSAESGQVDHLLFGRNEPALHHYHSHFREALGMEPLERIGP